MVSPSSWLLAALPVIAAAASAMAAERPSPPCKLAPTEPARVAAVLDSRTLRLADGTQVRLAGLAGLDLSGVTDGASAAAAQAKAALADLVAGKSVTLQILREDRYGRRVALVALAGADSAPSLQHQLIARGEAVVASRVEPAGCAADYLAAERAARAARLGVWADPYYLIRRAEQPAAVSQARGRFALVEGKVLSIGDRGATIYLNFGRRWSEDFTVTIAKRNERSFAAAGLAPKSFAGRRILIRGWVDERGGPWIEALRPEQIEFADRE